MESSIISLASTLFFIACSAIQVYVTLRIVKIEKNILDEVDERIDKAMQNMRREFLREIDHLQRQINNLQK